MGLWSKLKSGLKKTSTNFNEKLKKVFVHKKLDEDTLDAFEDMLIESDFGVETASHFRNILEKNKFDQEITEQELKEFLSVEIETILENVAKPLDVSDHKPFIVLVNGVNGVGKTTTIGKLANC